MRLQVAVQAKNSWYGETSGGTIIRDGETDFQIYAYVSERNEKVEIKGFKKFCFTYDEVNNTWKIEEIK